MYKAIVISRPDRPNRLAHFKAQADAAQVPFIYFPALTPADTTVPKTWTVDPGGGYCSMLSHIGAIEKAASDGNPSWPVIVFEDDAVIPTDFNKRWQLLAQYKHAKPQDQWWDLLMLGGVDSSDNHPSWPTPTGFWPSYRIHARSWMECYAIAPRALDFVLRAFHVFASSPPWKFWASAVLMSLQRTLRVEGPLNPIVFQAREKFGSDNWGTLTSHAYPNEGLIAGWFSKQDGLVYSTEALRVPEGGHIVEVGSFCGRSLSWILPDAIARNVRVDPVDHWKFKGMFESDKNPDVTWSKFQWYMKRFGLWDHIEKAASRREGSPDAAHHYVDGTLDLVMIDGDHSYQAVKKDIETWLPKLKKHGTIMGHDYWNHKPPHPGVKKAVDEIFANVETNRLGSGLWVVRL